MSRTPSTSSTSKNLKTALSQAILLRWCNRRTSTRPWSRTWRWTTSRCRGPWTRAKSASEISWWSTWTTTSSEKGSIRSLTPVWRLTSEASKPLSRDRGLKMFKLPNSTCTSSSSRGSSNCNSSKFLTSKRLKRNRGQKLWSSSGWLSSSKLLRRRKPSSRLRLKGKERLNFKGKKRKPLKSRLRNRRFCSSREKSSRGSINNNFWFSNKKRRNKLKLGLGPFKKNKRDWRHKNRPSSGDKLSFKDKQNCKDKSKRGKLSFKGKERLNYKGRPKFKDKLKFRGRLRSLGSKKKLRKKDNRSSLSRNSLKNRNGPKNWLKSKPRSS